ncbi:aldehyde:ferredoxin oxidoreductase, bis-(molybdopterin)-oxotungsten-containing [Geotalea daltonii FRC-32]|uniref:Aldehyde:ferredoxin oxidoreductase, bis-(Molybdopterin)-oxotungsten-containing n=1 Tax=Geotalea daltonii (strain DSM 22248 / JCM 15807 / FRC-32) TaxID=316067 RepID=B9M973_GEODF|nr:aldehyde ferredoxin oxidoreductase C-terminal domain-containing protein [Geotalea daltonii]ACM18631.1 aldehyde:ferredoxin oxidoreductase, bis-(molybdopterin)-oxotungsten-containing [Geotalea daltonii FRC-32]
MHYEATKLNHGYAGRILTIDLPSRAIEAPMLDEHVRDYFLGGRGLGLYLLHQSVTSTTRATDPENPLILANGPLGGIPQFPGTAKAMAVSLSPITGVPGVSNFGGYFGAFLKYAGFDALKVTGKAGRDVMIIIDGLKHQVAVEEIAHLDEAFDLERMIDERYTGLGIDRRHIAFMSTGIGADHTTFGCINSHYFDMTKPTPNGRGIYRTKQAGRTGIGSVMSGKGIRAIVVLAAYPQGENPYGAADWERAKDAGKRLHQVVKEVDPTSLRMSRKGSAGLITFMSKDEYQSLPVNNFQAGSDPRAPQICGSHYEEHLFEHRGMDGCFPGCNLQCNKGGWVTLVSGAHKGSRVWVDGPEYETAAGFGSNLGIWNPEFILEANWHCDNYGIDTISTATILAFVMECFQRGFLTSAAADGLELAWGNEGAALEFIHRLARGQGELYKQAGGGMLPLVDWVAAGCKAKTGRDVRGELDLFAMQTKGLPFSFYRTHRSLSMQGSYAAASDIGAHHAAAWLIKADLLGAFPTFEEKAWALISYPRVRLGNDNLGLCKLPWVDVFNPESARRTDTDIHINPASQEIYADFFNSMLGTDMSWEEIFAQTDRDINLQRVMNVVRFGDKTRAYDWIPDRAIGPTDDALYEGEGDYNDGEVAGILGVSSEEVAAMATSRKRIVLMDYRKQELQRLIDVYYAERGWNRAGIPFIDTLQELGLWSYLTAETQAKIAGLQEIVEIVAPA